MTGHCERPRVAIVTGASRGLGRAIALALDADGWRVVADARGAPELADLAQGASDALVALRGSVTDPAHRRAVVEAARALGGVDLLVNNASELGPSPLPPLACHDLDALRAVYETNLLAPVALAQLALPDLRASGGTLVNISSDAAVEAYRGWGGYGSSKAALDHATAVLAVEEPAVRCYAVDPGDLRTDMHQRAFPGEDISDRPLPSTVVPGLLRLLRQHPASGRFRLADLLSAAESGGGS